MREWTKHCTFSDVSGLSAPEIVTVFQELWRQGLCDQVYIDYLDLIPYEAKHSNMSEDVGTKLATLKAGAAACKHDKTDGGIPIVISGQPVKEYDEANKPTMDKAFGSVRIQQYASHFLIMWRERNKEGEATGYTTITVAKNAAGGREGQDVVFRVAGDAERRGFIFYPVSRYGYAPPPPKGNGLEEADLKISGPEKEEPPSVQKTQA